MDAHHTPKIGATAFSGRSIHLSKMLARNSGMLATVLFVALAFQIETHVGGSSTADFFGNWIYTAIPFLAGISCVLGGARDRERLAWSLVGAGMIAWALGDAYYTFVLQPMKVVPFPSLADVGYLAFYPPVYVGLGLLVRSRVTGFGRSLWLDGVIGALTAAALATSVVFDAVWHSIGGSAGAVATNLAYPLADMLLLALVVGVLALSGWRLTRTWMLVGGGFALFGISDSVYLYRVANDSYQYGTLLDLGWLGAMLLLAYAAQQPPRRSRASQLEGRRLLIVPTTFALVCLGLEVWDHFRQTDILGLALASAALAAVIARMAFTFNEYLHVLDTTRTESLTDSLTGLSNRRQLMRDLDRILAAEATRDHLLLLFDLDGFKSYNDRFGHLAGDALLQLLGERLGRTVRGRGAAYRLGGDEFCAIVSGGIEDIEWLRAATATSLGEIGEGFEIGTSCGAIHLPSEASDVSEALRLVDRRMYQEKAARRSRGIEGRAALMNVLRERDPSLVEHLTEVASLVVSVGEQLGIEGHELGNLKLAGELHDIGKLAVPESILGKRGPLNEDEWTFIQQHPVISERIIYGVPGLEQIAAPVRATHERWDGTGYPDGLSGEAIPLAARIIAVCDAYDAMTSPRPYRQKSISVTEAMRDRYEPVGVGEALAELHRCAGTQFDGEVIAAFERVIAQPALIARRAS